MKKRIITALALAAVVGVGAGVGSIALNSSKTVETKATGEAASTRRIYCENNPNANWENMYCHYWGEGITGTTWPGIQMTEYTWNQDDVKTFYLDVPSGVNGLVFHNNDGSQTEDIKGTDVTMNFFYIEDNYGKFIGHGYDATLDKMYALDLFGTYFNGTNKGYLYAWNGAKHNHDWPGNIMWTLSGRMYYRDLFNTDDYNCCIFAEQNGGYESETLSLNKDQCFVITGVNTHFTGSWISVEAAAFIDTYMKFAGEDKIDVSTGSLDTTRCSANYDDAAKEYNKLSDDSVRSDVLSISVVKDRLLNWAAQNGDTVNDDGSEITIHKNAAKTVNFSDNDNNGNTIIAIAVVASITVAAAAGYIFLRRRKESR